MLNTLRGTSPLSETMSDTTLERNRAEKALLTKNHSQSQVILHKMNTNLKNYADKNGNDVSKNVHTGRKTFAFWTLICLLFLLAIGNLVLTFTILAVLRLGHGLESMEFLPEHNAIKFFGETNLDHIYKRDGLIESFQDVPMSISSEEGSILFNLQSRLSRSDTKILVNTSGVYFKGVNTFEVTDPVTGEQVFSTANPEITVAESLNNLIAKQISTKRISSPVDKNLTIRSESSAYLRGAEEMPPFVEKQPTQIEDPFEKLVAPQADPRKSEIVYPAVVGIGYIHLAAIYGLYLAVTAAQWYTLIFAAFTAVATGIGITAGAHRLWSHRAYKAKPPLQILLMIMQSMAFQYSAITWAKIHRMHHRYSDTDADLHNVTRGFFFSHMGHLLVKSHPEFRKRVKLMDLSDLYSNPILKLQHKYTTLFCFTFCLLLPTVIPVYLWGESLSVAWHVAMLRYAYTLHATFLINSFAHRFGSGSYDKSIKPTQNAFVSLIMYGEGFHNYHHVFPWDYRTAELGNNWLNLSTLFIDFFAWVGWAYDLKTVPDDIISARAKRTGDGTNSWGFKTKTK